MLLVRARYWKHSAHVTIPLYHPIVKVVVLVEEAAKVTDSWQYEECTEETDAKHKTFQLVGTFTVDFHDSTNTEERNKASQQEQCSNREINAERKQ